MRQVTAAVIIEDGRLLLTRRPPDDPLAGLWELPGGKVEAEETPQECLSRELVEELEMESSVGELLAQTIYHYDHGSFEMLAFATARHSGYQLRVHDAAEWVTRERLPEYELAPADVELVREIVASGGW